MASSASSTAAGGVAEQQYSCTRSGVGSRNRLPGRRRHRPMPWTRGVHVGVLLLSSCSLCSVAPAVEHVRTKKQWLALIDAPTGGKTSPETGVFTRSSATSVVTCTRESWIKDAFESVAEVFHDRFQFLHSEDRKLCRELSLRDDSIGLVTSIYQSATTGERDLQSLDLRGRAAEANVATLPPRMARGQLQEFLASATLPLVGFLTVDSMMSGYNTARPLVTLFCPFSSVSDEIDPQDVDSRVTRQNMFARSSQAAWCRAPLVAAMGLLSASDTQSNVAAAVAEIEEHRQMELQEFGYDDLDGVGVGARTSAGFKYRLEPTDQVPPVQVLAEFVRNVIAAERQGDHGTGVVTYQHHGEDGSARTLQPYLKSAARPRPSKEAVRTVVGETFRDIVQSERDDVLIVLYAPWCEVCPRLLSELKTTATALRKSKAKGIEVVRFDVTANDAPKSYWADEMPTIYWAPIESKESPEKYGGDFTSNGFKSFLCGKRHAAGRPLPARLGCPQMSAADAKEL